MKRVFGSILCFVGFLFLLDKEFNFLHNYELFFSYWPMLLILLGVAIQNSFPKKKKR